MSPFFKTGGQSGRRRLEFIVNTDSPKSPAIPLALVATCYSEWDAFAADGHSRFSLRPGRGGERVYEIIARHRGDIKYSPHILSCDPSIESRFEGGETEKNLTDGVVEVARRLVVTLPSTMQPGVRHAKVILGAGDAPARTLDVEWFVSPSLTLAPPGLVIKRDGVVAARSVVVHSDDVPFRLLGLSGPKLVGAFRPSSEARTSHRIDLQFDTSAMSGREVFDVRVETDHPDQPVVQLGVLVS